MARARINPDGTGVRLGLTFREAAALKALLQRVGDSTNAEINLETSSVYFSLAEVEEAVSRQNQSLWTGDFDDFACRGSVLVDEES